MRKPTCEICEKKHKKYSVTEGASYVTAMAGTPAYWDEKGDYHPYQDPNVTTTTYHCSNGHSWNVKS